MRHRHHRYDVPGYAHPDRGMNANVALAVVLCTIIAGITIANILLAGVVDCFSAFLVLTQP